MQFGTHNNIDNSKFTRSTTTAALYRYSSEIWIWKIHGFVRVGVTFDVVVSTLTTLFRNDWRLKCWCSSWKYNSWNPGLLVWVFSFGSFFRGRWLFYPRMEELGQWGAVQEPQFWRAQGYICCSYAWTDLSKKGAERVKPKISIHREKTEEEEAGKDWKEEEEEDSFFRPEKLRNWSKSRKNI